MKKENSSLNWWIKLNGLCLICSYWDMYKTHILEWLLLFLKDLIGKSILRSEGWRHKIIFFIFLLQVPSISNEPEKNLSSFRNLLPTFYFIGIERHIDSSIPYVVDDDVQLVCKYLWALNEEKRRPGWGIDKLFYCK